METEQKQSRILHYQMKNGRLENIIEQGSREWDALSDETKAEMLAATTIDIKDLLQQ